MKTTIIVWRCALIFDFVTCSTFRPVAKFTIAFTKRAREVLWRAIKTFNFISMQPSNSGHEFCNPKEWRGPYILLDPGFRNLLLLRFVSLQESSQWRRTLSTLALALRALWAWIVPLAPPHAHRQQDPHATSCAKPHDSLAVTDPNWICL